MPAAWKVELHGLIEAQQKAIQTLKDLYGEPMEQAIKTALLLAFRTARKLAKVDTGRYRASITPEVRMSSMGETQVIEGVLGSALSYSPYVVLDTQPHFPPPAALQTWVHRKGLGGKVNSQGKIKRASKKVEAGIAFLVARAIAKKGTKGDRSLIRGFEDNAPRIVRLIEAAVKTIVEK